MRQDVSMEEGEDAVSVSWDLNSIKEDEFEKYVVYIVPDLPVKTDCANRAESTLPRNLVLKPSQALSDVLGVWSTSYIPRGTRFGPLVGEVYAKNAVPTTANRKYFWRVSIVKFTNKCSFMFCTFLFWFCFLSSFVPVFQCDICKKRFSSTSNLKTHLRLHSGQKPYACDLCPAKFTQFVHLKLHKRLHTNERPYTCQGCNKKYISASGLRTHWKTTSCRPNNMEEEMAIAAAAGSPPGYYDFVGSDLSMGMLEKEGREADSRDSFEMHHSSHGMEPSVSVNVPVTEPQRPTVIESNQPHIIECT